MAQIQFDQIRNDSDNPNFKVGFFSLKNDGDEAVVRFLHDSTDSFDLVTTHPVQVGGKFRRVNCIRDPRESLDNCPLCRSGQKIQQRFYIHLINYEKDENGNIVAQPQVWERTASYAITLKNLIDEYGPLSNCIFKIRRNGKAGSMDTTYTILYGNPQVYREEMYPIDADAFQDYKAVGNVVMDKTFDDLAEYVATGAFPETPTAKTNTPVSNKDDDVPFNYIESIPEQLNVRPVPQDGKDINIYPPVQSTITQATPNPGARPVRYY